MRSPSLAPVTLEAQIGHPGHRLSSESPRGVTELPIRGSLAYTFVAAAAATRKEFQCFQMYGNREICTEAGLPGRYVSIGACDARGPVIGVMPRCWTRRSPPPGATAPGSTARPSA
jgi:hypothetical protein